MADPQPNGASTGETVKNDYQWLALYFLCNLTLTIYNKAVMQFVGFNYPWYVCYIRILTKSTYPHIYNQ